MSLKVPVIPQPVSVVKCVTSVFTLRTVPLCKVREVTTQARETHAELVPPELEREERGEQESVGLGEDSLVSGDILYLQLHDSLAVVIREPDREGAGLNSFDHTTLNFDPLASLLVDRGERERETDATDDGLEHEKIPEWGRGG